MMEMMVEGLLRQTAEWLRDDGFGGSGQNAYTGMGRVDGLTGRVPACQQDDNGRLGREDRAALAVRVWRVVDALPDGAGEVLRLWLLGDYADAGRLAKARAFQAAMRGKGMRVRLSYTYSLRQLALLWGCGREAATRRVRMALAAAEDALRCEVFGLDLYSSTLEVKDNF